MTVDVPVIMQAKVPAVQVAQKTAEIPQAQVPDQVVHAPGVVQHQVPMFIDDVALTTDSSQPQNRCLVGKGDQLTKRILTLERAQTRAPKMLTNVPLPQLQYGGPNEFGIKKGRIDLYRALSNLGPGKPGSAGEVDFLVLRQCGSPRLLAGQWQHLV